MKRNRRNPKRERARRRWAQRHTTRREQLSMSSKSSQGIVTPKRTITKAHISAGGLTL